MIGWVFTFIFTAVAQTEMYWLYFLKIEFSIGFLKLKSELGA